MPIAFPVAIRIASRGLRRAQPSVVCAALLLAGCMAGQTQPISHSAARGEAGKIAPVLAAAAKRLAAGTPASAFAQGPVRADSEGRLQVYVYVSDLSSAAQAELAANGLKAGRAVAALHLVEGWVRPEHLPELAALPFVRRIAPPQYGRTRRLP